MGWAARSSDADRASQGVVERGPLHPRAYGTYPRVLGKYVREEGVITLEDAIRKMTSAVADRLGLRERGWNADIAVPNQREDAAPMLPRADSRGEIHDGQDLGVA